jgi:hypothetical protein
MKKYEKLNFITNVIYGKKLIDYKFHFIYIFVYFIKATF